MTKSCFKAKAFSIGKMSGSLREHNERDFGAHHKRPGYILDQVHPLGNEEFHRMTPEAVIKEYMATTKWGQKHGKLHHRAKPLREAIITFEAHHTQADFENLADALEAELGIRTIYCHIHRDEGKVYDDGEVKFNFHAHYGFTNLVDGKLVHFDQIKCQRAQDICSRVLGMERGVKGSKAIALDHREFRPVVAEITRLNKRIDEKDDDIDELKSVNAELRQQMKELNAVAKGTVTQADYQALKKIKDDADLEHREKLVQMEKLVEDLKKKQIQVQKVLLSVDAEREAYRGNYLAMRDSNDKLRKAAQEPIKPDQTESESLRADLFYVENITLPMAQKQSQKEKYPAIFIDGHAKAGKQKPRFGDQFQKLIDRIKETAVEWLRVNNGKEYINVVEKNDYTEHLYEARKRRAEYDERIKAYNQTPSNQIKTR